MAKPTKFEGYKGITLFVCPLFTSLVSASLSKLFNGFQWNFTYEHKTQSVDMHIGQLIPITDNSHVFF